MTTGITQFLIAAVVVAIHVLLWRVRRENFARVGKSWAYILLGSGSVAVGEVGNVLFPLLVREGVLSAAFTEGLMIAVHSFIVGGLFFIALGVLRMQLAGQQLLAETATVIQRDGDLRKRISRDGMLLSTVPAALYRTSGSQSGAASDIEFVNDKIVDLLGYDVGQFEANPRLFLSLMHPEDRERFDSERQALWNEDTAVVEHRFRHKDGDYRWIRRYLKSMRRENGERAEWHGCAFDITDLKQAEGRLMNFLDAAPDALIAIRKDGKIVMANTPATTLFAYSESELIGLHIETLIPDDGAGHERSVLDYFSDGSLSLAGTAGDRFGHRKDGATFPAEIRLSPLETEDEPILICCVRDVSRQKETEAQLQQAQKMQSVGQLTGGIAHDFNNMLTVVIGNLQLLERAATYNHALSHPVKAAIDASMRAVELVKRLLAFSRRQLLAPKNTRINDLIAEIEPLLRRTVTQNVTLNTRLADDLWLARIDPSQLENALVNLALNARDAMGPSGRLTIETSNTVLDETYTAQNPEVVPGDYVMLAVSDNGHGISSEFLPKVFEPFFTTKEVGRGSGLGLSMVYGFVKQSQGHIKIYSEVGHGTTIKIYIPRSGSAKGDRVEHVKGNEVVPGGDETILLVEDDDSVREVAINLLTSLGYTVVPANCGAEALSIMAERDDIHLVFTDIIMPGGMTGTDLARKLLEDYPGLKILFTSGYTDTAVFDNQLLKRGNEILNKPYRHEELARALRNLLDEE